jgi:ATP-dependent Clp protease adaptor protein ClpS
MRIRKPEIAIDSNARLVQQLQSMSKESSTGSSVPKRRAKPTTRRKPKRRMLPQYHVVLVDDNDHTYGYVVEMLQGLFLHSQQRAFKMAREVDTRGKVIVLTTHKELAELKRDQILRYGADWRLPRCKGSMTAYIEPAP